MNEQQKANKQNLFYSGAHDNARQEVHERFAHRWRDRQSTGDRLIEDLLDEENFLHQGWRLLTRRNWPTNPHQDEIAQMARGWEPT
jgi:hypothetical protein